MNIFPFYLRSASFTFSIEFEIEILFHCYLASLHCTLSQKPNIHKPLGFFDSARYSLEYFSFCHQAMFFLAVEFSTHVLIIL